MKKIVFIGLFFCFFFACNTPFPNFKFIGNDTYMQLISFEESSIDYNKGTYVEAEIKAYDGKQIIYHNYKENYLKNEEEFNFFFKHLKEGDSAIFMVNKANFLKTKQPFQYSNSKNRYLKVCIKIHSYFSKEKYDEEIVDVDKEIQEQLLLKRYLKENNVTSLNKKNGVYILKNVEGKGDSIVLGKDVQIKYKASFINYLQFDNTRDKTFKLRYGTPDQVIKGLEIALKGMSKGEKSKIIIPSQFAFGEEGSSTGIVPPYTTVVYDLEIINVN